MKLFEDTSNPKGVTLHSQIAELLNIVDDNTISREEQDRRINEYVQMLRERVARCQRAEEQYGKDAGYQVYLIEEIIDLLPGNLTEEQKRQVKELYLESARDSSMMDTPVMKKKLSDRGLDEGIADDVLTIIKTEEFRVKTGMTEMTPEGVRALHDFICDPAKGVTFINVDDAGKYSGCMSYDGETFVPAKLDKVAEFTRRHGLDLKINTFFFYADFPSMYERFCEVKYTTPDMTSEQKHEIMKQKMQETLYTYMENMCDRYGDSLSAVDIFNELIYDPVMIEPQFRGSEDNLGLGRYHQRVGQWMKYFDIDDLAEFALAARQRLPNTRFVYNDMNWVTPEKRTEMIAFVKKLQAKEAEFIAQGRLQPGQRLIDTIGLEAHLGTDVDIAQLDRTLDDIERELGLPAEVTELDISRDSSKTEIEKQRKIMARIQKLSPRFGALAIWSLNDKMCFVNDKAGAIVFGSILDSNFQEKEFDEEREVDQTQQGFNYHTHTKLCGHASGETEEYIEKAIEGEFKTIGFSDHNPPVIGNNNPRSSMSREQFWSDYIPEMNRLKQLYGDRIDIKVGLEVEYYGDEAEQYHYPDKDGGVLPSPAESRGRMEPELDYMILGQHFALARDDQGHIIEPPRMADKHSARYPLEYALTVVEAMKSGKFAYVAHPDIFLQERDKVPEDQRDEYEMNAGKATRMICETASKLKIPLELNLGAIAKSRARNIPLCRDGNYEYPVPAFWETAAAYGCDVLIGVDAHTPESLKDRTNEAIAKKLMSDSGIELNYLESFEPRGIGHEAELSTGVDVKNQMLEMAEETAREGTVGEVASTVYRRQKEKEDPEAERETQENDGEQLE